MEADPSEVETHLANLLRRSGRGELEAFADLYDATVGTVYATVLALFPDTSRAASVTRDCYVDVWRLANRFDAGHRSVASWMDVVTRHRATMSARSAPPAAGLA